MEVFADDQADCLQLGWAQIHIFEISQAIIMAIVGGNFFIEHDLQQLGMSGGVGVVESQVNGGISGVFELHTAETASGRYALPDGRGVEIFKPVLPGEICEHRYCLLVFELSLDV